MWTGFSAALNPSASVAPWMWPPLAPPPRPSSPTRSVLFLPMAVAAWLVWRDHGFRGAGAALKLYLAQLLANALWSWLFFAWRQGAFAFAEVVVLWLLIAATIFSFWRLHRLAALLLVPYLAWVSFAAALNFVLWRLNPVVLG